MISGTVPKNSTKMISKKSEQNTPKGLQSGDQNPSKIVKKSSLGRLGSPPASFGLKKWSRRGVPPQNGREIDQQSSTKRKKMAIAPPIKVGFSEAYF